MPKTVALQCRSQTSDRSGAFPAAPRKTTVKMIRTSLIRAHRQLLPVRSLLSLLLLGLMPRGTAARTYGLYT